jgi:Site-specific recombinases, DNA invertase Pin homologs
MEPKTIRVIEPNVPPKPPLLRVAAYCRVSTEREEQECSLKAQVSHFTKLICDNPEWDFAGIYAESESGVRMKNRHELDRLLADCDAGQIDIVLMKSISRLSRNTLDTLTIYNQVVLKGIELRFELEHLSTNDKRVRKMFTTLAAVAQNDSWARSEDIKWGMRHQANKGKAILNHNRFLGYTKDSAGHLVIVEDEANVVRLIYSLFLEGKGYRQIKKYLEQNDIKTVSGKAEWSTSTIDRMLSNEKYVGRLITQKTYVKDFLDGRQHKNTGEVQQQTFENHHEAIIASEMFERVQQEKQRRSLKQDVSQEMQMQY